MGRKAIMQVSRFGFSMRRPCSSQIVKPQWYCQRPYSIQSQEEEIARLPDLNPGALSITRAATLKHVLPPEELIFGRNFTGKHATTLPESKPHLVLTRFNIQIICSQLNGQLHKAGFPHESRLIKTSVSILQHASFTTHLNASRV